MTRALGAILFGLLLCVAVPAAAQTFPALSGRVVDQANIIPDDREAAMTQQLEQLQRATSRQLVVATVPDLQGYAVEDYANALFREWRLGQAEANNGILLLVAPTERKVRIEVGYGLEGIVTDAFSGQVIRDQIVPRFRENDYPGGIEAGTNALIVQLAAPPEQAEQRVLEAEQARQRGSGGGGNSGDGVIVIVVLGFIVLIFVGAVSSATGGRRYRPGRVSPWGSRYDQRNDDNGIGWVVASAVLDAILSGPRGGGSSWSSGGGSSWGGGGSSWGGGGGGFSGGGGSSGGGGASGSW